MSDVFVGREAEARVILGNTEARRSSLIVGEASMGKAAPLAFLKPALHDIGQPVIASRLQPFRTFLREAFEGCWE